MTVIFQAMYESWKEEGMRGLYRGVPCHMIHMAALVSSKMVARRLVDKIEDIKPAPIGFEDKSDEGKRKRRHVAKYLCEILCYPLLTLATRALIVTPSITEIKRWNKADGIRLWYQGLWPHILGLCLDDASQSLIRKMVADFDKEERSIMEMSTQAVASVLIIPITNISVVRRCHSHLLYLLEPKPLLEQINSNPWAAIFFNLGVFSFFLAANYYIIRLKDEDDY